ncbi:MAG: hypothetical protein ACO1SX_20300 [Actinomycetota bacterium]
MKITKIHFSRLLLAGVLATVTLPAIPAAAQFGRRDDRRPNVRRQSLNMVRLGSKEVDGRRDRDTIEVNARGRFRGIVLRVTDSRARIHNVVVHFENGETFRPVLRRDFRPGASSHVINLPGRARDIDRVTFNYSDLRGRGEADVTLFGVR